jgi:hypothetical protein
MDARTGLPVNVAPGSGVSGSEFAARAPSRTPIRLASPVLFVHEHRYAEKTRGEDARQRRVATKTNNDARAVATHDADRAHHRDERVPEREHVAKGEPALQPAPGQYVDLEARVRNDASFDPAPAADESNRVTPRTKLLGDRDRGVRVTAGPAARQDREHRLGHDDRD